MKALGLFVVLLAISATALGEAPLKVMTFNIRYDRGHKSPIGQEHPWVADQGRSRRDLVLDVIEAANPDILGLQEALEHQVRSVCERLKAHRCYTVGRLDGKQAGEHCTILYRSERFELVASDTFWLCDTPNRPGAKHPDAACERIASWVRLRDRQNAGREVLVLNTHWDHVGQPAREYAAQAIVDLLAQARAGAEVIVMGDLNATPGNRAYKALLEDKRLELTDSYRMVNTKPLDDERTGHSFKGTTKGERIDHVLATRGLRPTTAAIVRKSFDGVYPSDHYPVVVSLTWK